MAYIVPIVIALLVFTGIIYIVAQADKKKTVGARVRKLTPQEGSADAIDPEEVALSLDEQVSPSAEILEKLLLAIGINVEKYREEHQLRFHRAGLTAPSAPVVYLFFKYIVSVALVLIGVMLILIPASGLERVFFFMIGVLLGLAGLLGPEIYMKNATQKNQQVLQRSFPDALDLLLVCVESGLALDGALARVCRELGRAHPEITAELNRTRMELTLLNDRAQALQNLADRTGLLPFRSLVGTLMQSEKFGTNLTETLRVLAEDYRMQRLMAAENKAGRLPVLMTIPLICFMMPAFFMVIMGPAILSLVEVLKSR